MGCIFAKPSDQVPSDDQKIVNAALKEVCGDSVEKKVFKQM